MTDDELRPACATPSPEGLYQVGEALRRGWTVADLAAITRSDPWFLDQMAMIVEEREHLEGVGFEAMTTRSWRRAKQLGYSDAQLAYIWGVRELEVRSARLDAGVRPTFKPVDTCPAEFYAKTP